MGPWINDYQRSGVHLVEQQRLQHMNTTTAFMCPRVLLSTVIEVEEEGYTTKVIGQPKNLPTENTGRVDRRSQHVLNVKMRAEISCRT